MTQDMMCEGCGLRLREAREARELTVEAVAEVLKLGVRQLQAIEAEEWSSFPSQAALRGFIRAYAYHLGLDPHGLFSEEIAPTLLDPQDPITAPSTGIRFSGTGMRTWMLIVPGVVLVFFVLVMALYAWLAQDNETGVDAGSAAITSPVLLPAVVGAGEVSASASSAALGATSDVAATPVVPVSPEAAPSARPVSPETSSRPPVSGADNAATASAGAKTAAANVAPIPSSRPQAGTESASAPAAMATGPGSKELVFTASSDAWIEIVDAKGQRIRRLVNPYLPFKVSGLPPFKLVIGNAAHVRLSYNGSAVDLRPFIGEKVARLSIE